MVKKRGRGGEGGLWNLRLRGVEGKLLVRLVLEVGGYLRCGA